MKAAPIPKRSRELVGQRDRWRCARCGIPSPCGHWHHRRSRSVRDEHVNCPCNGVWLDPVCHAWAHSNVVLSRAEGFVVSRSVADPSTVPFHTPAGWRLPDCSGGWREPL